MYMILYIVAFAVYGLAKLTIKKFSVLDFFVMPWLFAFSLIYLNRDNLIFYDELSIFAVFIFILYVFLVSNYVGFMQPNNSDTKSINEISSLISKVFPVIISLVLIAAILSAFSYDGGVVEFVLRARYSLMYEETPPGILENELFYRLFKNALLLGHSLSILLFIIGARITGVWLLLVTVIGYLITGERWGSIYALLSLGILVFMSAKDKVKLALAFAVCILVAFWLGSLMRGRGDIGDIVSDTLIYIYGGIIAFSSIISGHCADCYSPPTYRYILALVGLSEKNTNIIGSNVTVTHDGLWTNTFSIWGSTYLNGGFIFTTFSVITLLIFAVVLNSHSNKSVYVKWMLALLLPALPLTIFTETLYQLVPLYLRVFVLFVIIKGLSRVRCFTL